jgi:hypothetical protein
MHRSGTSLVANILQEAGVNIGENLLGPNRGNNRGHFEDVDFFDFHEKVLKRFEQTLLVQNLTCLGALTPAEIETALVLINQRHDKHIWGWKDPRTALFLDFWYDLLPEARYVLIYRHPLEVVLSLLRRGSDPEVLSNPLVGLYSWQAYNQSLLNFYQQHREICLLGHIRTITADINAFVLQVSQKLALPLRGEDLQRLYHSTELKGTTFSSAATTILEKLTPEIILLYEQLEAQADLPGNFLAEVVPLSDPQLIKLQGIVINQSNDQTLEKGWSAHLFQQLLWTLAPEIVSASKEALDELRLEHIRLLRNQVDELWQHTNNLRAQLTNIEKTRAWRLVMSWYSFKQHLKALARSIERKLSLHQYQPEDIESSQPEKTT